MKLYHTDRYGRIVVCKTKASRTCSSSTHITEEEKNFLSTENYENQALTENQERIYLMNLNSAQRKKYFDALEKKQYFAQPDDYDYRRKSEFRRTDPFALTMITLLSLEKEYADDQKYNDTTNVEGMKSKESVNRVLIEKGDYKPNRAHNIVLVRHYFENLNKIKIPEGTVMRTTKPKPKLQDLVAPYSRQFKILHVNTGSNRSYASSSSGAAKPCSVTWLGKNGWLYNVEITQTILDAN